MAELELDPQERVLCFAQLLGMCDQITFPLGRLRQTNTKLANKKCLPFQVKRVTACTSMCHMVPSMRSFHICQEGININILYSWFQCLNSHWIKFRANENGGMLGKVALEKNMLGKELFRRITKGQIFYKPKGEYKPIGFN